MRLKHCAFVNSQALPWTASVTPDDPLQLLQDSRYDLQPRSLLVHGYKNRLLSDDVDVSVLSLTLKHGLGSNMASGRSGLVVHSARLHQYTCITQHGANVPFSFFVTPVLLRPILSGLRQLQMRETEMHALQDCLCTARIRCVEHEAGAKTGYIIGQVCSFVALLNQKPTCHSCDHCHLCLVSRIDQVSWKQPMFSGNVSVTAQR